MKKIYLSLIVLLSVFKTFSQNVGYIITIHNDTIYCAKVKAVFIGGGARYKIKNSDDFKRISADSIKEYQLSNDSSTYRAVALKPGADPFFLQLVTRGSICLYVMYTTNYSGTTTTTTTTDWYVSKNNAPVIMLKTNGINLFAPSHDDRKAALANLFADDPQVLAAYKADDSFSFKTIKKYVQQYNHDALAQGK